jgi:hypothetical protein
LNGSRKTIAEFYGIPTQNREYRLALLEKTMNDAKERTMAMKARGAF